MIVIGISEFFLTFLAAVTPEIPLPIITRREPDIPDFGDSFFLNAEKFISLYGKKAELNSINILI